MKRKWKEGSPTDVHSGERKAKREISESCIKTPSPNFPNEAANISTTTSKKLEIISRLGTTKTIVRLIAN